MLLESFEGVEILYFQLLFDSHVWAGRTGPQLYSYPQIKFIYLTVNKLRIGAEKNAEALVYRSSTYCCFSSGSFCPGAQGVGRHI